MKIEELKKLAKLSRIELSDEELEKYLQQMTTIIDSANVLNEISTDNVKIFSLLRKKLIDLREDKVTTGLSQGDVLANAPYSQNGYIKVYGKVNEELEES